jgi:hypothetical protein
MKLESSKHSALPNERCATSDRAPSLLMSDHLVRGRYLWACNFLANLPGLKTNDFVATVSSICASFSQLLAKPFFSSPRKKQE